MIHELVPKLESGDILIDGGNSYYIDDIRPRRSFRRRAFTTSMSAPARRVGLDRGYCQMIGGENEVVKRLDPIFKTLAPGRGSIDRTPGREKAAGTAEEGYLHCVQTVRVIL